MTHALDNSAIDSFTARMGLVSSPDAADTLAEVDFLCARLQLQPGQRVLDLPCGNGRHARVLAERGLEVVAADIDPTSLALARAQAGHPRVQHVELDVRAAASLGLEFDAVISLCSCLGYLEDAGEDRAGLRALCSVLRPGGGIVLSSANGPVVARVQPSPIVFEHGNMLIERVDHHDAETRVLHRRFAVHDRRSGQRVEEIVHRRRLYASDEVSALLAEFGITNIECVADFRGARFDPARSAHVIYVGERQR